MIIGEVCLHTNDVIKLAKFYRWLLKLEDYNNDKTHQFIINKETILSIFNDGLPRANNNQNISLAFTVDDVDEEYDRLVEYGVRIIEKPATRPWGARNMHFVDPDGNHIYFRSFPK